jgi:hypothetical protein
MPIGLLLVDWGSQVNAMTESNVAFNDCLRPRKVVHSIAVPYNAKKYPSKLTISFF